MAVGRDSAAFYVGKGLSGILQRTAFCDVYVI